MITLEKEFVSGAGGYAQEPLTYKQLFRTENVALYARYRGDGTLKDHEVFKIKVTPKGTEIFKKITEDDIECYPSSNVFGKTAWSYKNYNAALQKYNDLVLESAERAEIDFKENVENAMNAPRRGKGRRRVVRPELVFPTSETWSMKELLAANSEAYTHPSAYVTLQEKIKAGLVVEVARVPQGRGKPAVMYKVV